MVSGEHWRDSAIHINVFSLSQTPLPSLSVILQFRNGILRLILFSLLCAWSPGKASRVLCTGFCQFNQRGLNSFTSLFKSGYEIGSLKWSLWMTDCYVEITSFVFYLYFSAQCLPTAVQISEVLNSGEQQRHQLWGAWQALFTVTQWLSPILLTLLYQ